MNDHLDHDLELVAALAGGWIADPDEASDARGLVGSCRECRAEYELHTDIRQRLAAAPHPELTPEERAALRTGVHAAIDEGATVVPLSDRRTRRWLQVGTVAAAMVVVAGLGGLLLGELGGGDDASDVLAQDTAETEAGSELDPTLGLQRESAEETATTDAAVAAAPEAEEAMEEEAPAEAPGDAVASEDEGGDFGTDLESELVVQLGEVTIETLAEEVGTAIIAAEEDPSGPLLTAAWYGSRELTTPECLTSDVEPAYRAIEAAVAGVPVEVFVVPAEDDPTPVAVAFETDGCVPFELPS